ncbi:hypothetical protein UFOVP778_22 [uncultured Caudovirales phage]|uniref:Uncharacterized protein n=1 Tax=uncultured Caudovirales phage TaxID=2100421 RepID=A0A6J5NYI3_9CAUD|nr:hypothetical protein UFOVP778_22 [uncultured Caudovirales phage]
MTEQIETLWDKIQSLEERIEQLEKSNTSSQTEISDEDIEKAAKEWYEKEGHYKPSAIALKTWGYAIKWYREQLKQRQ